MQRYHFKLGSLCSFSGKLALIEWKKANENQQKTDALFTPTNSKNRFTIWSFYKYFGSKVTSGRDWSLRYAQLSAFRRSNLKHLLTLERVMLKQKTVVFLGGCMFRILYPPLFSAKIVGREESYTSVLLPSFPGPRFKAL